MNKLSRTLDSAYNLDTLVGRANFKALVDMAVKEFPGVITKNADTPFDYKT